MEILIEVQQDSLLLFLLCCLIAFILKFFKLNYKNIL